MTFFYYNNGGYQRTDQEENDNACDNLALNPVNLAYGNKYQKEIDYSAAGIEVVRLYDSRGWSTSDMDGYWKLDFNYPLPFTVSSDPDVIEDELVLGTRVIIDTQTGKLVRQEFTNEENWVDLGPAFLNIERHSTGYRYFTKDNRRVEYDLYGVPLKIVRPGASTILLEYDANKRLIKVTPEGTTKEVSFSYDSNNRVNKVHTPDGDITYTYSDSDNELTSVTYPDGTSRSYFYGNDNRLTKIVNENGDTEGIWEYDNNGRVISYKQSDDAEMATIAYRINYDEGRWYTDMTNVLGQTTTFKFAMENERRRLISVTGQSTQLCSEFIKTMSYYPSGLLSSKTNKNNMVTTYSYNNIGLRIARTQAVGTPEERTITTEWHSEFRLPTRITEPGRVTEYTYDTQGRQLSRTTSSTQ
jgi:YD repeat-containing protein